MMKKPSNKSSFSVAAMKALLEQYACPLPFYQLRARLMGNIATPDMTASPMQEIQRIWNNELPVFDSKSEAEEFFGVLFQGLWNALSTHQKRTEPFKLTRIATAPASLEFLSKVCPCPTRGDRRLCCTGYSVTQMSWTCRKVHTKLSPFLARCARFLQRRNNWLRSPRVSRASPRP